MSGAIELRHLHTKEIKDAAGLGDTPNLAVLDHTPDLNEYGDGYKVATEETIENGPRPELTHEDVLFLAPILMRLQRELSSRASAPMNQKRRSFRPSAPGARRSEPKPNKQNAGSGPVIAPHHLKALMRLNYKNPADIKAFMFLLVNIRAYNPALKGLVRQGQSRDMQRIRKIQTNYILGRAPAPKAKKQSVLRLEGEAANRLERTARYDEEAPEPKKISRHELLGMQLTPADNRAPRKANMYETLNEELKALKLKAQAEEDAPKPKKKRAPRVRLSPAPTYG